MTKHRKELENQLWELAVEVSPGLEREDFPSFDWFVDQLEALIDKAVRKEREKVFKEILAWAENGRLSTYPSHYFIAGLETIKSKLTKGN